ncbi:EAL domain-containing protein [Paucibacter sp. AS339]|uniref:EAL domain-containing protein n=1 Tax=Paucibacter hankyongi TaxID=3133434 RepID=UPI00309FECA7
MTIRTEPVTLSDVPSSPGAASHRHLALSKRIASYFGALFLLAMTALLALWYFGLPQLGISGAADMRLNQALRTLEARADLQRDNLASGIKERRGDVLIVAENVVLSGLLDRRESAQASLLRVFERWQRAYPDRFQGLALLDPETERVVASSDAAEVGQAFRQPELIRMLRQPGALEVVAEMAGPDGRRGLGIFRQMHVRDADGYVSGRLVGVVVAFIDLQKFVDFGAAFELTGAGQLGATLLFDSTGRPLARFPELEGAAEVYESNSRLTVGFEGSLREQGRGGEKLLVVYRPLPLSGSRGWNLAHFILEREAVEGLSDTAWRLGLAGVLLTLLGLVLINWLARRLSLPLQTLATAARALGAGDLTVRAEVAERDQSREVAVLATAFNSMARDIARAHHTLETQVRERSEELQRSEARHRTLFEFSADAVLLLNGGLVIDCNPAALRMFGVDSREQLLGRHPADLSPPLQPSGESSRLAAEKITELSLQDGSLAFEWLHQRIDSGAAFMTEVLLNRVEVEGLALMQATIRDISARKASEERLRLSEENLAITLQSIGDAVIATDAGGRITRMNTTAERLTGWTLAEALGRSLAEVFRIINVQTREPSTNPVQSVMAHGQVVGLANHTALLARDGREYQISDSAAPIRDSAGTILGVVLVFSDVTEDYRMREALDRSAALLARTGELAKVGGWELDLRSNTLIWSDETYRIHDLEPSSVPPPAWGLDLFAAEIRPQLEAAMQTAIEQGTPYDLELPIITVRGRSKWLRTQGFAEQEGGVTLRLAGTFQDITERRASEEQIKSLAYYDPLTGLPNRRLLMDRLQKALATGLRHQHLGALLFVDLDNFKTLNDTLGHEYGDILLVQVAKRLSACVRDCDTVARLGGDEFVVMLEDLSGEPAEAAAQADVVGRKMLELLGKGYELSTQEHHSTPSIGVTLFGERPEGIDEPLKRADLAMYQAKAAGKNTLRAFDPQMQAVVTARVALEQGLREGLAQGQFFLYFQAQLMQQPSAGSGFDRIVGAEVLLRWRHPQRGMVSPAEFIPLAEDTGLILPLGEWVLDAACRQLADWAARADQPELAALSVAVNVSAKQFHQDGFVEQVQAVLARTGARPERLKLELTEGLLVNNIEEVTAKMQALKAIGVGFSLDDFGTGYSSLAYLKRLPLDQLKIDQGFVRDILVDPNDAAIARMVVVLADSLGLSVIAEGVETEEQRDFLRSQGCFAYQGYLFSRPLPVGEFEALLASTVSRGDVGSVLS